MIDKNNKWVEQKDCRWFCPSSLSYGGRCLCPNTRNLYCFNYYRCLEFETYNEMFKRA